MSTQILDNLYQALQQQNFDVALDLYAQVFTKDGKVNPQVTEPRLPHLNTHLVNAASLSRRSGYEASSQCRGISARLDEAIDFFFGVKPVEYDRETQRPNFLYVPDLPSDGFFDEQEIPGIAELVRIIRDFKPLLLEFCTTRQENYIANGTTVPQSDDWHELRQENWLSTHFIKGGERRFAEEEILQEFYSVFDSPLIADCPPHGPEVFLSVLKSGAYIPPHFGISNVKLTVHIPFEVDEAASITVNGKTKNWHPSQEVIIFDDSFEHSAQNQSSNSRSVLIFDIWNPYLSEAEREGIRQFIVIQDEWAKNYGHLANLDASLR